MRPHRYRFRTSLAATAAALIGFAACESENPLDTNLVTVENLPDMFTFDVSGLDNVTGGVQHVWSMTGAQVDVVVTQSVTSGTAILQIRDGGGTVVYQENIRDAIGTDTTRTSLGASGFWQISVALTKVTGAFTFTAQRVDSLIP